MIDKSPLAIRPEFIVERNGKSFVLYAGLLDRAHAEGLKRITTKLLQIPSEENSQTAICSAEVETERGTFAGIGDASPANVARAMLTCTIRLAETRAKARALRDAVNVGVAALEELGDTSEPEQATATTPTPMRQPSANTGEVATTAKLRAITKLAQQRGVNLKSAGVDIDALTKAQASTLINRWQQEAIARTA